MSDRLNRARIQRLRETRRAQGFKEASVWLEKAVDSAIDEAVESGRYPSRQAAISAALKWVFIERYAKTVT